MNNGRSSQIFLKVIDEFFNKENGKIQKRFIRDMKKIFIKNMKKKTSVEKVFFVLFSFYLLFVCLL